MGRDVDGERWGGTCYRGARGLNRRLSPLWIALTELRNCLHSRKRSDPGLMGNATHDLLLYLPLEYMLLPQEGFIPLIQISNMINCLDTDVVQGCSENRSNNLPHYNLRLYLDIK